MTPEAFKTARRKLGLSQGQAARMLGFSSGQHVSKIERGVYPVSETAARLMAAYVAGYRPPDWPQGRGKTEDG